MCLNMGSSAWRVQLVLYRSAPCSGLSVLCCWWAACTSGSAKPSSPCSDMPYSPRAVAGCQMGVSLAWPRAALPGAHGPASAGAGRAGCTALRAEAGRVGEDCARPQCAGQAGHRQCRERSEAAPRGSMGIWGPAWATDSGAAEPPWQVQRPCWAGLGLILVLSGPRHGPQPEAEVMPRGANHAWIW